ncbi:MAG: DUF4266 domain-containing protein, partial [Sulfurovaceae bacterium]|nr:DUF4266 domain-containing protein [Sulfurovaceae bacterium]
MIRDIIVLISLLLISGCSIKDVKPWEKETLAKDTMKVNAGNSLFTKFENHIYFSKEGSKGGGGVAGGG